MYPDMGPGMEPTAQVYALNGELHPWPWVCKAEALNTEPNCPGLLNHVTDRHDRVQQTGFQNPKELNLLGWRKDIK